MINLIFIHNIYRDELSQIRQISGVFKKATEAPVVKSKKATTALVVKIQFYISLKTNCFCGSHKTAALIFFVSVKYPPVIMTGS